MKIRISRIIEETQVEGPGRRFVIYVQGCRIRCKGCANQELWDETKGEELSVNAIVERIEKLRERLDGITILGGEPTEQAAPVSYLAKKAREMGLNVILFTGRLYEDIRKDIEIKNSKLLSNVDLLIDGPYMEGERDFSRPLVGSKNQRFIFLTDAICASDIMKCKNAFEIVIKPDGCVAVNGMGDIEKLKKLI